MSQLFEESDSEIEIKTNNEYAKSYDTWRKKEELNKFKARYGETALEVESNDEDSSEDDENAVELTEEVEKDFYKTLALLKKKDPKIYDDKVIFFKESNESKKHTMKADKKQTMSLKDYERQLLLEKGGVLSESESEEFKESKTSWKIEEENQLKKSFRVIDEESDEDIGSLLKAREETKEVKEKEEADYKAWLIGQKAKLKDEETASSLKYLKDYWNDPKLEEGEKFLRDCLLNNRYLATENKDYIPTYDEIVQDPSEDESELEKQEEFEHKYNFRFEEPDQEFIKRYPRTIEGSLRREDSKRKLKRQEVKERKAREKEEKMEDLRRLRDMKRKEIEGKIEKLREITGNQEIAFNDEDIDGDFDPEAHDRKMQALFNDEYYKDGPDEDTKPPIDLDDEDAIELQPENYDSWTGNTQNQSEYDGPHCEDDDFNMDAEYDPKATQKELVDNTRKKKKRKRKSKFVEMLAKNRPKFDPLDTNYQKYMDEYYKFDCEDIIDDVPFKFKYRKVVPNDFGLSVEEILVAKDRELNKWCSLKKAVSLRDEHVEKYEQIAYEKKGQNIQLKKKIIPSLFEEGENEAESEVKNDIKSNGISGKKRKTTDNADCSLSKKKMEDHVEPTTETESAFVVSSSIGESPKKRKKQKCAPTQESVTDGNQTTTKRKRKNTENGEKIEIENQITRKKKNKNNKEENGLSSSNGVNQEIVDNTLNNGKSMSKKKKKRKKKQNEADANTNNDLKNQGNPSINQNIEDKNLKEKNSKKKNSLKRKHLESSIQQNSTKKFKKNKKDVDIGVSDSRIMAFGWNPKKYKNKVIYGNKDEK